MDKRYIRIGDELLEVAFMDTVDKLYVRKDLLESLISSSNEINLLKGKIKELEDKIKDLESAN